MSERGDQRDYASGLEAVPGQAERWLSIYEAAAMVLQHPDTVRRWIADGLVRSEVRGRLGVRVPESDVSRYLATNFLGDKRNPANHALSSNVINAIPTHNQSRERDSHGAGWPFNRRAEDGVVAGPTLSPDREAQPPDAG